MKISKIMYPLCFSLLSISGFAQENKTVKEESTIKKVVVKEGSNVKVEEIENVQTDNGAIIVEGNQETNQEFRDATQKDSSQKMLTDKTEVDATNEALVAAAEKRRQEELQKSIDRQNAEADVQRKMFEEKQRQLQQAMEENRKRLEARPKGIVKLHRDDD